MSLQQTIQALDESIAEKTGLQDAHKSAVGIAIKGADYRFKVKSLS